jgi:uncharacterized protein YcfJ
MRKLSILFSASVATLLAAVAATSQAASRYDEADVLSSTPIYRTVQISSPRRECWEEEVQHVSRSRDRSHTPTLLGAVIGGALGNELGHNKSNKRVGAVVGAVLGGSIAGDLRRTYGNDEEVVTIDTVERCRRVSDTREEEKLVGYDVRYSYNGLEQTVRMDHDPGETVRVRVKVEPVL